MIENQLNNYQNQYIYILTVFSTGNITGIFGGKYYWYGRRIIMLVFSAENDTGIFGGNYYWYGRR